MGRKANDLTGQRFGRLTVVERRGSNKRGDALWLCVCDCGRDAVVTSVHLRGGGTKSCGCIQRERVSASLQVYGEHREKLYNVWYEMLRRCHNEKSRDYKNYGAKGITVCEEWRTCFKAFYDWAIAHGFQEGLTIDRIKNEENYCPENCRWATMKEQQNNRSNNHLVTFNGKTQTLSQWSDELGIPYHTLSNRINAHGWSVERAFSTT